MEKIDKRACVQGSYFIHPQLTTNNKNGFWNPAN